MKVNVTSRSGHEFLFEDTQLTSEREGDDWVLEIPDSTEEFLRFIEPLGRFSIELDRERIVLFFENDYD